MPLNCDLDALVAASSCFLSPCMSRTEREAIDVYVRARHLTFEAGPDYTDIDTLAAAVGAWATLSEEQRDAIRLYINIQNLLEVLPDENTDAAFLKAQSACIMCIGEETRKNMLVFLKCQLNSRNLTE